MPRWGLKVASVLLNLLVLRLAWALVGAYAGALGLIGLGYVFGKVLGHVLLPMPRVSEPEINLGSGATLPVSALVLLAAATVGATLFTIGWSRLMRAVDRRLASG